METIKKESLACGLRKTDGHPSRTHQNSLEKGSVILTPCLAFWVNHLKQPILIFSPIIFAFAIFSTLPTLNWNI